MSPERLIVVGSPDYRLTAAILARGFTPVYVAEEPPTPTMQELTNTMPDKELSKLCESIGRIEKPKLQHWYEPCLKRRRKK